MAALKALASAASIQEDELIRCIMVIDVGTVSVKCFLFDHDLNMVHSNLNKMKIAQPAENTCELVPEELNKAVKAGIEDCVDQCPKNMKIYCCGLTTQLNSIILWNSKTNQACSNFILWNDNRPIQKSNMLNTGRLLFNTKIATKLASFLLNNPYLRSMNDFKIETTQVTARLAALVEKQREIAKTTQLIVNTCYGTLDTWVLDKLTQGKVHMTDITNASSSGITELHKGQWCEFTCNMFAIPSRILPQINDSCHLYGFLKGEYNPASYSIPITSDIGNNQAACLAECADVPGDVVICFGSGTFINANFGKNPVVSKSGEGYPQWGYKSKLKKLFLHYYPVQTSGIALEKAIELGFYRDYAELESILASVETLDYKYNSVLCLPSYGLNRTFSVVDMASNSRSSVASASLPFNGIVNVDTTTRNEDIVRAIVQTLLFSVRLKFEALKKDFEDQRIKLNKIRVTGGLSRSNAFCQHLSNLMDLPIERSAYSAHSAAVGAAFLAGLCSHLYGDLGDLRNLRKGVETFYPNQQSDRRHENGLASWLEATRCYTNLI